MALRGSMQDFESRDIQDDDEVEITDLDPQDEVSNTSRPHMLLRFVRKIPISTNARAKLITLALLASVIVLLLLLQPLLPSIPRQVSNTTPVQATFSSQHSIAQLVGVDISSTNGFIWFKVSNGILIYVGPTSDGSHWHRCRLQQQSSNPGQGSQSIALVCP